MGTDEITPNGSVVPSKYDAAAKAVKVLSWTQIAVPIAAVLVTLPGSLYLLVFAGPIIAVPVALGILGLGLAKSVRLGHRTTATAVWALLHLCAYVTLALLSTTWDARDAGETKFFLLSRIVFWLAAAAYASIPVILVTRSRGSTQTPIEADLYPSHRPSFWLWLLAALLILAAIGSGIATAVKT